MQEIVKILSFMCAAKSSKISGEISFSHLRKIFRSRKVSLCVAPVAGRAGAGAGESLWRVRRHFMVIRCWVRAGSADSDQADPDLA